MIKKYLKLYRTKGIGAVYFKRLLKIYGNIDNVFSNLEEISKFFKTPIQWFDNVEEELLIAKKYDIKYIIDIPEHLSKIEEFPPILSYIGNIDLLNKNIITIVGTRKPTILGINFTTELVKNLNNKYVTCSGFAKGIDSVVHRESVNTIAFLPGGLINYYPKENALLYEKIKNTGLLLSDTHPEYEIKSFDFARRNQYLSILGSLLIITEAGENSGSLITAEFNKKFNKPIYVVPGHPYDLNYKGNNKLLKTGANILLDYKDINNNNLSEKIYQSDIVLTKPSVEERQIIIDLLSLVPVSINDIILHSNIKLEKVIVIIMELEILGLVTVNNNYISKNL